jgi:predicted ester cyclase
MSAEQNKAALRCIREVVFNCGNLELIDELFASDYIEHTPVPPGWPRSGLEGFKIFVTTLCSAFPDVHYTVETIFAEAEMAAGSITARATHRGEFLGIAPTGREVRWTETQVGRYENGKLVEHWYNSDDLGMLQQIGAVPELGEQGVEPLSRYAVEFSATTGKPEGIARPVLFGTAIALAQPRLFGLGVLGEGGWQKALKLEDYAPRRRRARALHQTPLPYHEAWG